MRYKSNKPTEVSKSEVCELQQLHCISPDGALHTLGGLRTLGRRSVAQMDGGWSTAARSSIICSKRGQPAGYCYYIPAPIGKI